MRTIQVSSEEILSGSIVWTMVRLGWPAMVTGTFHALSNLADAFWIGHLPPAQSGPSVAAIQISWPVIWLLISFAGGFSGAAASALISQYTGAGRLDEANFACTQIFSVTVIAGIAVGIAGYLFSPLLLPLLVESGEVTEAAAIYIRVMFLGIPFLVVPFLFHFSLAAYGDTVTPMIVNGGAVLLNLALDPLLIFGIGPWPAWGIFGAALATVISQGLGSLVVLFILLRGWRGLRVRLAEARPQLRWMKAITGIGLPAAIGQSGTAMGFVVLMGIIGRVPEATIALAAYGVGDRIFGLLFIGINGLGVGLTTVLGQSLGAEKLSRAQETVKKGIALIFSLLAIEALIIWLIRRPLMAAFIPGREDIIAEGIWFITVFAPAMPFFGLFVAVAAIFRGSGHNVPTMIMGLARLWGLRVPLCYLLALVLEMGATGVWLGMTISNVASAMVALALFSTGIWRRKVIS